MKRISIIILLLVGVSKLINIESRQVLIPDNAIRFRVIANSNSSYDQIEKKKIAKELSYDILTVLKDSNGIEDARKRIQDNLTNFEQKVNNTIENDNYIQKANVHYGKNYFPEKEYKGVKYEAGEYESLVVTLGNGNGENFWCVLFPPLCLLEAEDTKTEEVEYKSFVKELIDKYF